MHTNPEVLALLALGEHVADPADRRHLDSCPQCRDELATLSRLIGHGSAPDDGYGDVLDAPSEAVWAGIQAELGFIPVTRDWATAPDPSQPDPSRPHPSQPEPSVPEPAARNRS